MYVVVIPVREQGSRERVENELDEGSLQSGEGGMCMKCILSKTNGAAEKKTSGESTKLQGEGEKK